MLHVRGSHSITTLRAALGDLVRRVRGVPSNVPPPRAQVGAPLDDVNDGFHDAYDRARTQAHQESPVFVVLADTLVFVHGDARRAYSFAPRAFHVIKSVSHAPVALYAALAAQPHRHLDDATRSALGQLHGHVVGSLPRIDAEPELTPRTREACRQVLEASRAQIELALAGRLSEPDVEAFAERIGPTLRALVHDATALQLEALHAHVDAALAPLTGEQRATLHVVVTGDHQARTRSLGMQYFCKRLAEPADTEHRVTYAEGVSDEQGALALVGTRRFDRRLARAFFGDAQRLQRDILGDAAHDLLRDARLLPIA